MRISRAFIRPGAIGGNRRDISAGVQARLRMQFRIRGGMDWAKVSRSIGDMNARCLKYWGKVVKNAAKTGIGRGKGKVSKAAKNRMGVGKPIEFVGGLYVDLNAYGHGEARPAGQPIRSWAPKRFVYSDIVNYYDSSSRSVVVGTYKTAHWLAQLHQFGGTVKETAWRIGVGAARNAYLRSHSGGTGRDSRGRFTKGNSRAVVKSQYQYGAIRWQVDRSGLFRGSRNWERTTITRMAKYPARPYVQDAVKVVDAVRRANEAWRNQLRKSG